MIFNRISILRALFPARKAASEASLRWHRAARGEPELLADVLAFGGVLALQPDIYDQRGVPMGAPIDPVRLAYEAGRRDLAVQIAALMGVTRTELKSLMENDYDVS